MFETMLMLRNRSSILEPSTFLLQPTFLIGIQRYIYFEGLS